MTIRILCALFAIGAVSFAETLVLRNFTLIDGTGQQPAANSAMIVTDGRIQWVGAARQAKVPAGAQTVDLAGKYVMPGIINLHGHLGNVVGLTQDPKYFTRQNLTKQLDSYAQYGVTTVLSMGSDQLLVYDVRAEQRAGRPKTARIYTAGKGFTGPKGYPTSAPGMEVKKAMDELAPRKPDFVKIWVDDHLGKEQKIPTEISAAIISEAKKHGLRTCAHIFYYSDAKALAERGLYACAHSVRDRAVDDTLIQIMKKNGTWQLGTLVRELSVFVFAKAPAFLDDPFFTKSVEPQVVETVKTKTAAAQKADADLAKYPAFLATAQKNLKKLYDAGVKVGFATDSGPPARFSGFFEHKEMELMVEAGFTPMQIITTFSKSSAEFLGASKELGTLTAGHWADMVVLSKNPVADIRNARTIEAVYIAGNKVR
jgi:imidazolonepropionase-like amidohydrolase